MDEGIIHLFVDDCVDQSRGTTPHTMCSKLNRAAHSEGQNLADVSSPVIVTNNCRFPRVTFANGCSNEMGPSGEGKHRVSASSSVCCTAAAGKRVSKRQGEMRHSFSCNNFESDTSGDLEMPHALPPEVEEGNVEYKRKLVNPSADRFEHLVTQMKWRLNEGGGEAIYELGVDDDGRLTGLDVFELEESLGTLRRMAVRLNATISVLRERRLSNGHGRCRRKAVEILVRRLPHTQTPLDIRVAVLGSVDAGKSTLLGVLTGGEMDNGRGRARLNLFRHLHEIQSGRTSSISWEILGFDADGRVTNHFQTGPSMSRRVQRRPHEEVVCDSAKLVTLIDLAGHHKYQRTTLYGLTTCLPHYALLLVPATTGLLGTGQDHCLLALALGVPLIVVVSKVDLCSPEGTLEQVECRLNDLLGVCPTRVQSREDAVRALDTLVGNRTPPPPLFCVSSVTGEGVELLTWFLGQLPPPGKEGVGHGLSGSGCGCEGVEFWVGQVYDQLRDVSGTVLSGIVRAGGIHEGDKLILGPTEEGGFIPVTVRSLRRNRLPQRLVQAGQTAAVTVVMDSRRQEDGHRRASTTEVAVAVPARRGMVLLSTSPGPRAAALDSSVIAGAGVCWSVEVACHLHSSHQTSNLPSSFHTLVHCGNVCQPAIAKRLKPACQSVPSDSAACQETGGAVVFRFLKQPEFVHVGEWVLFTSPCPGGVGMGRVTHLMSTAASGNAVIGAEPDDDLCCRSPALVTTAHTN